MWTEPRDLRFDTINLEVAAASADGISSRFAPPAVVTAAGSVHTVSLDLPAQTLRALLTANGGELADFDGHFEPIADGRERPVKEPE